MELGQILLQIWTEIGLEQSNRNKKRKERRGTITGIVGCIRSCAHLVCTIGIAAAGLLVAISGLIQDSADLQSVSII